MSRANHGFRYRLPRHLYVCDRTGRRATATRLTLEVLEHRFVLSTTALPMPIASSAFTDQPTTLGEMQVDPDSVLTGPLVPGGASSDSRFDPGNAVPARAGALTSPYYAAVRPGGRLDDDQTSVMYDCETGEIGINAPRRVALTSINIDSADGIFADHDAVQNLGGSFDQHSERNIFKATFGGSFGTLSFGNIAQAGFSEDFIANDLTVIGSLGGGGCMGDVDLIYTCGGFRRDLSGADYSGQNLAGADFSLTDLTGADFSGANLTRARMSGAILIGANLSGANLTRAYLSGANLSHADLTSTDFTAATMGNAIFTGADLTEAGLATAYLPSADLSGAALAGADFSDSTLSGADLSGADGREADFTGARLNDAVLSGTDLAGASLRRAYLANASLADANLTGATIQGADLTAVMKHGFTPEQLYSTASYQRDDLSGLRLDANNLDQLDFAGKNLTGASFADASLSQTDFRNAIIEGANFRGATNRGFTAAQLRSTASYQHRELVGIELSESDLQGWDFSGQNLTGSQLWQANLSGANFAGANLVRAGLAGGSLSSANFDGALVHGAFFNYASDFDPEQLYRTASYQRGDLTAIGLRGLDLQGWDLSGQDLSAASLDETILSKTDLTGAIIRGADFSHATGLTSEQFYSTASHRQGDLRGINLGNMNLRNWSFTGQRLAGAEFWNAHLSGADFSMADLTGARLGSANLSGADLRGASLSDAHIHNAIFRSADLRGATGFSPEPYDPVENTQNMIWPNGRIRGLNLGARDTLVIQDSDRPISVAQEFTMSEGSVLELILDDTDWGSTISVRSNAEPQLGGTLRIRLAENTRPSAWLGRSFDLFKWTTAPEGSSRFDRMELPAGTTWDISRLYETGKVTLTGVFDPGDANQDNAFDGHDLMHVLEAGKYLTKQPAAWADGDWNRDHTFDQHDIVWALQLGNFL